MSNAVNTAVAAYLSNRNRVINGDCLVAQRAAAAFGTGVAGYAGPDAFFTQNSGAGGSFTQSATVMGGTRGVVKSCIAQQVGTVSTTIAGSATWFGICHYIEAVDCYDMDGAPAVLSFWFTASVAGTYAVTLRSINGTIYSYVTTIVLAAANVAQFYTINIPTIPTIGMPRSNLAGYIIQVGALNTGTFQAPVLNAWQTGAYFSATGATNWSATVGALIALTELKLESGPIRTPFDADPFEIALAKCQRRFETGTMVLVTSGTQPQISFAVPKRGTPTLALPTITTGTGATIGTLGANGLWQTAFNSATSSATWTASADL